MGIDILDFRFRIEKSFGFKIEADDYEKFPKTSLQAATAGDMHTWVVRLCEEKGARTPYSSWNRVKLALAQTVNKPLKRIHPDTLIVRDLGFS